MSFRKSVLIDSTRWRLHTFLWGVKTLPWARSVLHCEINPEGCRYFPEVYHAAFPCEKNKSNSNNNKKNIIKTNFTLLLQNEIKDLNITFLKGFRKKRGVAYIFKNSISFFFCSMRLRCDIKWCHYFFFIAFLLFISAYSFIFLFFFLLPSICLQQTRSRRWLTVTSPATTNIWTKLLFTQTASRVNLKSKQSAPSKKKFCSLIAVWEERR